MPQWPQRFEVNWVPLLLTLSTTGKGDLFLQRGASPLARGFRYCLCVLLPYPLTLSPLAGRRGGGQEAAPTGSREGQDAGALWM
jgi:hypothetical protein